MRGGVRARRDVRRSGDVRRSAGRRARGGELRLEHAHAIVKLLALLLGGAAQRALVVGALGLGRGALGLDDRLLLDTRELLGGGSADGLRGAQLIARPLQRGVERLQLGGGGLRLLGGGGLGGAELFVGRLQLGRGGAALGVGGCLRARRAGLGGGCATVVRGESLLDGSGVRTLRGRGVVCPLLGSCRPSRFQLRTLLAGFGALFELVRARLELLVCCACSCARASSC